VEHLPKRTNLVQETTATLKEWISGGILKETLPGERELKARLGIGRNTLRLALELLAKEGWLSSASRGRQRRVQKVEPLAHGDTGAAYRLPVTFLSPYSPVESETLVELEGLRVHLEEQGRRLQFLAPAIFRLQHPDHHLERLVHQHPSVAWVLHVASEPMQRWFARQGIRAFLYGSPFPEADLPFLVPDWEGAAFHAGIQLVRQRHRTIGLFEYQERFPGVLAAERGLQRALDTTGDPGRVVVFKDDLTPPSVAHSLEVAFGLKERPTAMVLTRSNQLLTCLSWCGSRGIRFPGDFSLVSLTHDTWFGELHPPITHYSTKPAMIARYLAERVMELVATGQVARKSLRLQLDYVPGATIGPAPRAKR
jgi:DNA-binding LacI/PurR family transcriptional regulator